VNDHTAWCTNNELFISDHYLLNDDGIHHFNCYIYREILFNESGFLCVINVKEDFEPKPLTKYV